MGGVVTVARRHQQAGLALNGNAFAQIDIVDPARIQEVAGAAVQAIDVQPGLLVSAHDQALRRIGRVAPDCRVVRRVGIGRADRRRFPPRRHGNGWGRTGDADVDWHLPLSSGAGRQRQQRQEGGEGRYTHQNFTRAPNFIVQPYCSNCSRFLPAPTRL